MNNKSKALLIHNPKLNKSLSIEKVHMKKWQNSVKSSINIYKTVFYAKMKSFNDLSNIVMKFG